MMLTTWCVTASVWIVRSTWAQVPKSSSHHPGRTFYAEKYR
jgi:hypothetical protein